MSTISTADKDTQQTLIQPKKKRLGVLIGGSGLIGGTLAHYFKTKTIDDIEIRAPSSKKLSIRDLNDIKTYLGRVRPDFVINTAIASIGSDAQLAYEVNYKGTVNLAKACGVLGIPYIHVSSAATLPAGENLTEDCELKLNSNLTNYAKSKLMAEKSLRFMGEKCGLDYTIIRLAIVYGEHDHKTQGFHRLFFSIADESMPFMITKKGIKFSYSNANKLPHFVHHVLEHREEFSRNTYHFVDKDPVELADLILTIRSYLELRRPYEVYVPYHIIKVGKYFLERLAKVFNWFGISVRLPPELMFLENFYQSQTLSSEKIRNSSYVDPSPDENIYSALPNLVVYYLSRWSHLNLIDTFSKNYFGENEVEEDFIHHPEKLLQEVHKNSIASFDDI
ncbi:MAG: NAD-dependent epimerase/dehydratase family protein [Desulfobulbaceae bacterium]|nr:NAD-dependent epimerase/dehydratase family protein [Desulfobulbaceae bacterium]